MRHVLPLLVAQHLGATCAPTPTEVYTEIGLQWLCDLVLRTWWPYPCPKLRLCFVHMVTLL